MKVEVKLTNQDILDYIKDLGWNANEEVFDEVLNIQLLLFKGYSQESGFDEAQREWFSNIVHHITRLQAALLVEYP